MSTNYWITTHLVYNVDGDKNLDPKQVAHKVKNAITVVVGSLDLAMAVLNELGYDEEEVIKRVHYAIYGMPKGLVPSL
jgi:hypothetical protein